jgi:hypothetical protein
VRATRKKDPPSEPVPDVSADDRTALTGAYKAGLIVAWKREAVLGYRLTLAGQQDEYVEVEQLTTYLKKLSSARAGVSPPLRNAER